MEKRILHCHFSNIFKSIISVIMWKDRHGERVFISRHLQWMVIGEVMDSSGGWVLSITACQGMDSELNICKSCSSTKGSSLPEVEELGCHDCCSDSWATEVCSLVMTEKIMGLRKGPDSLWCWLAQTSMGNKVCHGDLGLCSPFHYVLPGPVLNASSDAVSIISPGRPFQGLTHLRSCAIMGALGI